MSTWTLCSQSLLQRIPQKERSLYSVETSSWTISLKQLLHRQSLFSHCNRLPLNQANGKSCTFSRTLNLPREMLSHYFLCQTSHSSTSEPSMRFFTNGANCSEEKRRIWDEGKYELTQDWKKKRKAAMKAKRRLEIRRKM